MRGMSLDCTGTLAMTLLTPLVVARRIASLAGIVVLLALAATLLWQVYVHHHQADPYDREEPASVEVRRSVVEIRKNCDRLELNYSSTATRECGTPGAISMVGES